MIQEEENTQIEILIDLTYRLNYIETFQLQPQYRKQFLVKKIENSYKTTKFIKTIINQQISLKAQVQSNFFNYKGTINKKSKKPKKSIK